MKILAVFAALLGVGLADPTESMTNTDVMEYLKKYNYMGADNPMFWELSDDDAMPKAIAEFQVMAGLPATGTMDNETMETMMLPRCGKKDIDSMKDMTRRRKRRYAIQGSKWGAGSLTYMISKYTPDMNQADVDSEVDRALKVWSSVADLTFRKVSSGSVDINISFVDTVHGDGFDFDGAGGTLAHAFFPQFGGDVHMDEAERWTFETGTGINLFQVIAHEFGHSLGLSHSSIRSALMAPFYRGYVQDFKLDQDDIYGIQRIYGARPDMMATTTPNPVPTTTTTMAPVDPGMEPMPCADGHVDAMVMSEDDTVYAFRDNYYMKIEDYGVAPGYPRLISDDWDGLPDSVDATISYNTRYSYVYDWRTNRYTHTKLYGERVFFFKGSQLYLYEDGTKTLSAGYPKLISEVFPGIPSDIDAALRWGRNDRTYFMKGDQYYRVSRENVVRVNGQISVNPSPVDPNYPRDLSVWSGLPSSVDAAFLWRNGRTYFFKNELYYRIDDTNLKVDNGYPRETRRAWYGCTAGLEEDEKTTMMMEAEMMDDPMFNVMDHASNEEDSNDVSGQAPLRPWTLVISVIFTSLSALLLHGSV